MVTFRGLCACAQVKKNYGVTDEAIVLEWV